MLHSILYTIIHNIIIIYFAALSNEEVIRLNFLSFLSFPFLGKFMYCTFKLPIKKIKTSLFCANGHDNWIGVQIKMGSCYKSCVRVNLERVSKICFYNVHVL